MGTEGEGHHLESADCGGSDLGLRRVRTVSRGRVEKVMKGVIFSLGADYSVD